MLTLTCPHCGVQADETELLPGGEAHLKRHGPGSSEEEFEGYLFHRQNPKGPHLERWRHAFGCGKWFLAARDTVTMQVFGTYPASLATPTDEIRRRAGVERPGWGFEPGVPGEPEAVE
ncbi:sarcosine oxidase subunit delta [Rubellimicrobium rubrum]|uniref:Sarcosine oxidase subunit delta n=1 Tax=Rubellimicrobium rubrum TaxID=2585369 RepID=A0A5C4N5E2_9RHOB|nr:sarcosine oxidase subunit delta [Rubellimicrobium rubrum]TNC52858.1 sarcosine oxidase subunit delta [Rubellimicrobium rubrum]